MSKHRKGAVHLFPKIQRKKVKDSPKTNSRAPRKAPQRPLARFGACESWGLSQFFNPLSKEGKNQRAAKGHWRKPKATWPCRGFPGGKGSLTPVLGGKHSRHVRKSCCIVYTPSGTKPAGTGTARNAGPRQGAQNERAQGKGQQNQQEGNQKWGPQPISRGGGMSEERGNGTGVVPGSLGLKKQQGWGGGA